MAILVLLHPLLRRAYETFTLPTETVNTESSPAKASAIAAQARLQGRLRYDFYSSLVFISALIGLSALKVLLILYINFKIATALPRKAIPPATWIFNVGILFANELSQGYRFMSLGSMIEPFYASASDWGKTLDSYGGIMPRWEVLFKITVLRMISFNFDHYWSLERSRAGSPLEVCKHKVLRRTIVAFFALGHFALTESRRNNSIHLHCLKEKEYLYLLPLLFSRRSVHILLTSYTLHCTWRVQS